MSKGIYALFQKKLGGEFEKKFEAWHEAKMV